MHRFARPDPPTDFEEKVANARTGVAAAIGNEDDPAFPEKWKDFKDVLSRAQHRKCGYCECKTVVTSWGDVEHYAPKSEVWELSDDPAEWGTEAPDLINVRGRRKTVLNPPRGYWWLAYDWENYLLACTACNSAWKLSYFPVQEAPRAAPPEPTIDETPLLLNPFGRKDPAKHLEFHSDGTVTPRRSSQFGRETIKVCGLNRPRLQEVRRELARRTHERIDRIATAQPAAADEILRALYEDGLESQDHCGMVRAIYAERTGLTWSELEETFQN